MRHRRFATLDVALSYHDFDLDFAGIEEIEDQRKAIAFGKRLGQADQAQTAGHQPHGPLRS
jgi:hypothetical protein